MTNKEIAKKLKFVASLLEVHGENPFKVRGYQSAAFKAEEVGAAISDQNEEELIVLGFSKSMAGKIAQLVQEDSFPELEQLQANTPSGVIQMMNIKGIGGKKIAFLWQDAGITTLQQLQEAAESGKIAQLKGFGQKTQEQILSQIQFLKAQEGKMLYAKAEPFAEKLNVFLESLPFVESVSQCGQTRRNLEVIDTISFVVATADTSQLRKTLAKESELLYLESESGPRTWRGKVKENNLKVVIHLTAPEKFANTLFLHSASAPHLAFMTNEGLTLHQLASQQSFETEEAIYKRPELAYIAPEMREGDFEFELAKENRLPQLVEMNDLKGVLHNHSTYSDGKNSLREMAEYAKELGYEYLGITDHSQTAFYAKGLKEADVMKQHQEIDALNEELVPFKIFKGIESDILNDGQLDYPDEVLASFDFIVASIHANLNMDREKATERLVKAIQNPYTTILGHPTGRLLLKREGYPIDYQKVINACAEEGVSIEINANPLRLDLDWRWVRYALDKGVQISINPDAHEKEAYHQMRFGLLVGRKAGLTREMTLNARSVSELADFFASKKEKV